MHIFDVLGATMEEAAGTLSEWAAAGFPVVTAEEFTARKSACDACPKLVASPIGPACGICHCSTHLKPWIKTATCKLRRWSAIPMQR